MEWGWPQWVVAVYFLLRFFNMLRNYKSMKELTPAQGLIAFMIVGFVIYALHKGGFW